MQPGRGLAFAGSLLLTQSLAQMPVQAAVRRCGAFVSSDVVRAASELEAKKGAMDQWHAKAAKLGPGLDSWRLAADKSLQCFPKDKDFECVAFGRPCTIEQAPQPKDAKKQGV